MNNYLIIDGKSSLDFGLVISGRGVQNSPEKRYEELDIPGRNGKLLLNSDRFFNNVQVSYESFMYEDSPGCHSKWDHDQAFRQKALSDRLCAFRSFLGSRDGYFRLEDTYHPDEFRLAYYSEAFNPEMSQSLNVAQFTLNFTCKPQRFLKTGEEQITVTENSTIINPTLFDAKPMIRAYGTGSFSINGVSLKITSSDVYTDIDCDLMECYKDSANCNENVVLQNGAFPSLPAGDDVIKLAGITKLEIIPRWWVL